MNKALTVAAMIVASFTAAADAATVNYDSGSNTWTFSDFTQTGVGNYGSSGTLGGAGPHTRIGNGASAGWNSAGGWVYYDGSSEYTDYWHDESFSYTVTGATWSNINSNNGDGFFSIADFDTTGGTLTLGTAIAEGTLLNGTFSYGAGTAVGDGDATLVYTAAAAVPLPAAFPLLAFGVGALTIVRRRRRRV